VPTLHRLAAGGRRENSVFSQIAARASRIFREAFSLPG
jgi:hypothetical protein